MNTQNWLSLMEYSATHRVSLSTLRRRIKAGEIEFKFIEGKYLLKNEPFQPKGAGPDTIAPPKQVSGQDSAAPSVQNQPAPVPLPASAVSAGGPAGGGPGADTFWEITHGLLGEIKKAYTLVLQEKETSIRALSEEIADLKTLVRVLEQENEKLKTKPRPILGGDFDLGLEI